jgi:hypothetical protein
MYFFNFKKKKSKKENLININFIVKKKVYNYCAENFTPTKKIQKLEGSRWVLGTTKGQALWIVVERNKKKKREDMVVNVFCKVYFMGFDFCTTLIQQLYNNSSHEGGPQYMRPTLI